MTVPPPPAASSPQPSTTSAPAAVDWVVFDLGGVVFAPTQALPGLAERLGADQASFERAYYGHRDQLDLDSDHRRYWTSVAQELGVEQPPVTVLDELGAIDDRGWGQPMSPTEDLIDDLAAAGVKLAILSNAPGTMRATVSAQRWADVFAELLFSGELNLIKPDPQIFQTLLQRLGEPADRVAFLDDRADNVAAAGAAGIRAIQFTDAAAARDQLRGFGLPV